MEVSPDPSPIRHQLRHTAEQLECERLLLRRQPVDRGRDARDDLLEDVRLRGLRLDLLDVLLRDLALLELDLLELNRVRVEEDVEERRPLPGPPLLAAPEDPVQDDPHSGCDLAREVVLHERSEPLRLLAAPQPLPPPLDLHALRGVR